MRGVLGRGGESQAASLRAAQRGDVAAFNRLILAYQRQVYNLCFRMLGNREDAADATQEAFLHAYRALERFRGSPEGFVGWLFRIAANGCYDVLRKRGRSPTDSLDEPVDPSGELARWETVADASPGPDARVMSAETAARIQDGLDHLPAEQRLSVVLCDVQGLSYEEAASVMQVELGTVKSRLSRARAQLRTFLEARGELPGTRRRLDE